MDFSNTSSESLDRIVRGIAGVSGGTSVSLMSRRFPRLLPADSGRGYEEHTAVFAVQGVPDTLPLTKDADEVVVTLSGILGETRSKSDLLAELQHVFQDLGVEREWVAIAAVHKAPANGHTAYEVFIERDSAMNEPQWDA